MVYFFFDFFIANATPPAIALAKAPAIKAAFLGSFLIKSLAFCSAFLYFSLSLASSFFAFSSAFFNSFFNFSASAFALLAV